VNIIRRQLARDFSACGTQEGNLSREAAFVWQSASVYFGVKPLPAFRTTES